MNKVTENTLIPISLVITIISGVIMITIAVQDGRAQSMRQDKAEIELAQTKKDLATIKEGLIEDMATIKSDIRFIKEKVR